MADPSLSEIEFRRTGGHEQNFDEALRDSLRKAPWLIVSIAAHLLLFLIASQFEWSKPVEREEKVLMTIVPEKVIEKIEDNEEEEEKEETEIEVDEVQIDDPEFFEETASVDDFESENDPSLAFTRHDRMATLSTICVGPGGGGGGGDGGLVGKRGKGTGGSSDRAVDVALEWLAKHQDPRGYWSAAHFMNMCEENLQDGAGDANHDVGVSGLALLAFLGAGNTPSHGDYKKEVRKGLRYLSTVQDPETGCFGEPNSHETFLYDHAIATLAMTEGYWMSKSPRLKGPAQRAINFIHASRNPYKAWRYASPPDGNNDVSVTGWMVMALKSAKEAGLKVDEAALDGAKLFLDEMTDENSWRTGYLSRGSYSAREPGMEERWPQAKTEAMTAVAMLCRIFLGEDPDSSPALRGGADLLRKQLPLWDEKAGTIDYYYWYYGSYAMFQMAGQDWDRWQSRMLKAVVKTQRRDGCEEGSWDPQYDPWGHRGGRVYSTAIMTLCLQVFYRYDRVLGAR